MLTGKNALCVGATSGIGRAVAIHLAQLKANVTVVGRNPQLGSEVLAELNKYNPEGNHSVVIADASSMRGIESGCREYLAALGDKPLHYCVLSQVIKLLYSLPTAINLIALFFF
jgi:NAD(P)-dependent dehydrogenase (short-subunit alcohol dehydrogenase family)